MSSLRHRLKSLSLALRMIVASAVLAALVASVFAVLINAVSGLNDATRREAHAKDVTAATLRLEKLVLDLETGVRGYILTGEDGFLKPYREARQELASGRLREFERLASTTPEQGRRARNLTTAIRQYEQDYAVNLLNIARANPPAARDFVAREEGQRRTDEIRGQFTNFLAAENALAAASAGSADRQADRAVALAIAGLIASTLLIILFGIYLARSTARPVRGVAQAATRLAGGDLSTRLDEKGPGPGEVGELQVAFNQMAEQLERGRAELESQNEKLRESERLKSELVSIVSHELRTPLASVLGFTSLLLTREVSPEEQRRYLEIIDAQGRRLSSLLNDFLDIERLEEGQLKLARELFDMGTLVGEQAQLFAGQSEKHQLDVVLPPRPLPVRGDPDRMAQVVANLLSNAIKYSPEGGTVEVVGQREDDRVRVSVRDEGLGIPDELQEQVFGKFFRGDAPASGIAGTGLGLTIARSLVEAHGGTISFESATGEGSVFWLELPIAANDR
ncbi:MAG TPA: ATP-binding protein [Gaiellaceae bacterium]|nr:ATP-binding protein [Gaiellaceae bacterium]